ncbi:MAG: extracellular solute-binding protein [Dongiaceae bacterium]
MKLGIKGIGELSRRELLQTMTSLGLGVAAFAMAPGAARATTEVSYFTWAGYDAPEMHAAYKAKRGALPTFTLFADEAEALNKVRAGFTPDVSHPCIYDIGRWRDSGTILPIDSSRLANWPSVYQELRAVSGNQETGEQWIVPFDWGNGSVLYRTDLVDVQEESWSILFDEKYAGKLAMWSGIDGAVNVAAIVSGAQDIFDMTDEELAKAEDLLRKQRGLLRFYWDDPAQAEQALASGEVVAAYTWNQSLVNLQKQGLPVKYMKPKEGILTWVCGLVMMKDGAADEQARYDFIDAMLSTETGHFLIDGYGYGHSNSASFGTVAPARLAELGLPANPAEMFKGSRVLGIMDPQVRIKYTNMFEAVRAGS